VGDSTSIPVMDVIFGTSESDHYPITHIIYQQTMSQVLRDYNDVNNMRRLRERVAQEHPGKMYDENLVGRFGSRVEAYVEEMLRLHPDRQDDPAASFFSEMFAMAGSPRS
jgi:hypothetical protein